jgi:hypothetical protein
MTAATLKASRARLKASRQGKPVESPADHAYRLVALLKPAAASDPAPPSVAYRRYIEQRAFDTFMDLCAKAPVKARRP